MPDKSIAEAKRDGTYRADRYKTVVAGSGEAPADLARGVPAEVRKEYKRLLSLLPVERTERQDIVLVQQLAESLVLRAKAFADLMDNGIMREDTRHGGITSKNPAVLIWKQAGDSALALAKELGIGAKARRSLPEIDGADETTSVDDFFTWKVAADK